ncbi:MAG: zinc ribbon domain-containing protein [Acidobacteriota bacterium]
MPNYEFYCAGCHTVFSFFTPRPGDPRQPSCPRCAHPALVRRPSTFAAHVRGSAADRDDGGDAGAGDDPLAGVDDHRLEGAMDALVDEMERRGLDGDDVGQDPRALAHLMRRFGDLTGLQPGARMADYLDRLESGEDPEALEAAMESELGDDAALSDFFTLGKQLRARRTRRPAVDDTLHFL